VVKPTEEWDGHDRSSRLDRTAERIGVAFGMNVIAWSENLTPERAIAAGAEFVSKEALFKQADFLSVHVILSQRTRGLVGAEELSLMKPTARLINTSRGPIVTESDLVEALHARKIAGAAIDVFDQEPLPNGPTSRSWSSAPTMRRRPLDM
jgi:phosphoglycerate dehydrogenase-like enzyme